MIRRKGKKIKIYSKPPSEGPITIGFAFTNGEIKKNKVKEIIESFT